MAGLGETSRSPWPPLAIRPRVAPYPNYYYPNQPGVDFQFLAILRLVPRSWLDKAFVRAKSASNFQMIKLLVFNRIKIRLRF
jgi:hypothetical protein